jgi:hypothetical protein
MTLCECGCGEPTNIAKKTSTRDKTVKGEPVRYLPGHHQRTAWFRQLKRDEVKRGHLFHQGESSHLWQGDNITYGALHNWVNYSKSKTGICTNCGANVGPTTRAGTQWANVDHTYRRVLEDYIELCRACHAVYDIVNGLKSTPVDAQNAS